jgi:hypothetical protein
MLETFGPALRLWHGVALTSWFVAEGPYSRTTLAELAAYHRQDLAGVSALGCPVDQQLFADLVDAEKVLGEATPLTEADARGRQDGFPLRVSVIVGSRRSGFESLRDIITRHRRVWAEQFLYRYLRELWRTEIYSCGREYSRLYEELGKAPTIRRFSRHAEAPANHWFCGDVSALYTAFGEKSPVSPVRVALLPHNLQGFMWAVFVSLGGRRTSWSQLASTIVAGQREQQDAEWRVHLDRQRLAEACIQYVQLREAYGEPPSLAQFGKSRFASRSAFLDADVDRAWDRFSSVVERVLAEMCPRSAPRDA